MYKFGQETTPVLSGTTWPVQVAQYDRYIHREVHVRFCEKLGVKFP